MKMTCSGAINASPNEPSYNLLRVAYWFGRVDSRPLSLFRLCFGALLFKNALFFIPLAQLFYSDGGIVPRAQFWHDPAQVGLGQFSILNLAGASWMAILVFSVWAGVALALMAGYRTRLMAVLNYALWLSVIHRNPFLLHAPDQVMTVLSFWMIFLPLSHHYSVDSWLARRRPPAQHEHSLPAPGATDAFPLRIIQIQVALIYVLTTYYKWHGLFWRNGEALSYTFQQDSFLYPTGVWLGEHSPMWLLRLLTWSTLLIEAAFAPLVFAPLLQPWARATGLCLAALLHLGIALTMAIPDFSMAMWISHLLFFEPGWVMWLERQVRRLATRSPRAVTATKPLLWRLEKSSSQPIIGLHHKEQKEHKGERPEKFRVQPVTGQVARAVLLALLLTATIWGGFGPAKGVWARLAPAQPGFVQAINHQLHLSSPWSMFAYLTVPRIGRLLIDGRFENGADRLLYTSADPTSGRLYWRSGPGARLRFFEQRLLWSFPETILRAWAGYYCRLYNHERAHAAGMRLVTVEIHRYYRWAHQPGAPSNPYEQDLLWRHQCFENE